MAEIHTTPFLEKFGFDPFTGQWADEARESLVVECMKGRGFNYIPRISKPIPVFGAGSRTQVRRDGYGVTTGYDESNGDTDPDPNGVVLAALTDTQRTAWNQALLGGQSSGDGFGANSGCVQRAQIQLYGYATEFPPAYRTLVRQFVAAVAADPEVERVKALWRQCLVEDGYQVVNREAIVADLEKRRNLLLYGSTEAVAVGSGSPESPAFRALQQYERSIALADFDCDVKFGLTKAQESALDRVQLAYLNAHPAFDLTSFGS